MKTIEINEMEEALLKYGLEAFLDLTERAYVEANGQQKRSLEVQIEMINQTIEKFF